MTNSVTAWLALVLSLPTSNATARMRIWRALKSLGCAALRDGVYLLPESADAQQSLTELAGSAEEAGGNAQVLRVTSLAVQQDASLRALFDRSEQYRALCDLVRTSSAQAQRGAKALRTLQRDFETIAATDFFPGEAQAQARLALADLEAALSPGEPSPSHGRIRRLDIKKYQSRIWATRRQIWVDRMASAWLIRRFIDHRARFVWLATPQDCPRQALGFDFDGAAFTHIGARVTFEVLAASFGLEEDAAIAHMGRLVHFLDVGGLPSPEAAGVEAMLDGMRATLLDDDRLLEAACQAFDFLYQSIKNAKETS